ncbi:TetR/AcrR family transcriptional regulator [Tsuneonella rigui]|uniref:TetR/AcrR family transcriptional regulator n=1 Tax=Tsuneonella rigui TaxID=1708790 RepID=UPI002407F1A3|nr:TetR/AcrR family transcriptional regulator [Tsuneonella rigui]
MGSAALTEGRRRAPLRRPKRPDKAPKRDREDWLDCARSVLIAEGVERVKVKPLADVLGVTTGSFYHHFNGRQELLDGLLHHWETRTNGPMFSAVENAGPDPRNQLDALFHVWLNESEYEPAYDTAVRAWAHSSDAAKEVVRRVEDKRIGLLKSIFVRFGYDEQRAFIRARITYFHQVGYQAMEIVESPQQRRDLYALYLEALVGNPPDYPTET